MKFFKSIRNVWEYYKTNTNKPYELVKELESYCTLFGSRKWGGATPKSDVDLLADVKHLEAIVNIVIALKCKYRVHTNPYDGMAKQIDFYYAGILHSVSLSFTDDYLIQKEAIKVVTSFFEHYPQNVEKKWYRQEVFETMVAVLSGYIDSVPRDMEIFLSEKYPELLI